MQNNLQPLFEPKALGKRILEERIKRSLTIEKISDLTGVDKGQISRFCHGDFKRISKNLQKVCNELQIETPQRRSVSVRREPDADISDVIEEVRRNWEAAGSRQKAFGDALLALTKMLK